MAISDTAKRLMVLAETLKSSAATLMVMVVMVMTAIRAARSSLGIIIILILLDWCLFDGIGVYIDRYCTSVVNFVGTATDQPQRENETWWEMQL
jgi:hypothetical protein